MEIKRLFDLGSPLGGGGIHYHDYLQLDKILNAQDPESAKHAKTKRSGKNGEWWRCQIILRIK